MTSNKPTQSDYVRLGAEKSDTVQKVDALFQARFKELEDNDEAREALYVSYGRISDHLYGVYGSQYEEKESKKEYMAEDVRLNITVSDEEFKKMRKEALKGLKTRIGRPVMEEDDNSDIEIEEEKKKSRAERNTKDTCWTCKTCLKTFATKQKLQQHENKRFKCVAPMPSIPKTDNTDDNRFVCVCGKSYKNASHLSRHKTTCNQCVKSKNTIEAVQTDTFKLNNFGYETPKYNSSQFEKLFNEVNTKTRRFHIENFKTTKTWLDYKRYMLCFIKQMFFTTPENYTFYIPNMSEDFVWIYQNGKKTSIKKEQLITNMINHTITGFENILSNTANENEDIEDFIRYHPINFINGKLSFLDYDDDDDDNDNDVQVKNLLKSLEEGIIRLAMDYKDDIKRVWTKQGLY
jgi:hypothetical protein